MQYFAAQSQPGQQTTTSLRASLYTRGKRKRDEDGEEPPTSPTDGDDVNRPVALNTQSYASSSSLETAQLRVAGLLPGDASEIPPKPFPHAPVRTPKDNFNFTKIQGELAGLDPPLFVVNATSRARSIDAKSDGGELRQTHLTVLTTILHRCLLEGDFHRAGRAWGMILRSQIGGTPVDPRNHGRWGIGAEILLHRNSQKQSASTQNDQETTRDEQSASNEGSIYTEEGFQLAMEYYRLLIIHHAHRKTMPHAVDEMTFYPAMFSLWIYEICEKSKRLRKQNEKDNDRSLSGSNSNEDATLALEEVRAQEIAIRNEELQQAREIAQRLDKLVGSPPYDRYAEILRLRGMVGIWVGDLTLATDQNLDGSELGISDDPDHYGSDSPQDRLQSLAESYRILEQALEFFNRARAYGQRLTHEISSLEEKIEDLADKIKAFEGSACRTYSPS